jgi:hypothetical protein
MKNLNIIIALLVMLVSSCTKTGNYTAPTLPDAYISFDKTEMEYVQLPDRMHFIYKDSATGNITLPKVLTTSIN